MTRLLIILLLSLSAAGYAQTANPIVQGGTYYEFKNSVRIDSALFLPRRDTGVTNPTLKAPGMLLYRPADSLIYYLKGNTMTPLGGGSSGTSTNIYNSNGILTANRTLTGNQRTFGLTLDSLNSFAARANSFIAVGQNPAISGVNLTSFFLQPNQSNWRANTAAGQSINAQIDAGSSIEEGKFSVSTTTTSELFSVAGSASPAPGITFPQIKNNIAGDSLLTTTSTGKVILVHKNTVGSGITTLNGLSTPSQTFTTGTTGTDFNISSSGSVHTFNIPSASATARGVVSTGSQTFAGNKQFTGSVGVGLSSTARFSLGGSYFQNHLFNSINLTKASDASGLLTGLPADVTIISTPSGREIQSSADTTEVFHGINSTDFGGPYSSLSLIDSDTSATVGFITPPTTPNISGMMQITPREIYLGTAYDVPGQRGIFINRDKIFFTSSRANGLNWFNSTPDSTNILTGILHASNGISVVGNARFAGNGTPGMGRVPTGTDGVGNWQWEEPTPPENIAIADLTQTADRTLTGDNFNLTFNNQQIFSINSKVYQSIHTELPIGIIHLSDPAGLFTPVPGTSIQFINNTTGKTASQRIDSMQIDQIIEANGYHAQMGLRHRDTEKRAFLSLGTPNNDNNIDGLVQIDTNKIYIGTAEGLGNDRGILFDKQKLYFTNGIANPFPWLISAPDSTKLVSGIAHLSGALNVLGDARFAANGTPGIGKIPTGTDAAGNWNWTSPIGGVSSLNTLTGTLTLASGTAGTDFNISPSGSTITLNIPDASTTARGLVTTGTQGFTGSKSFTSLTATTSLQSSSTNANIYIPLASSAQSLVTTQKYIWGGANNTYLRVGFAGSTSTTLGANSNYGNVVLGITDITTAATGTHPFLGNLVVMRPSRTAGGATITNFANIISLGAPTGATNNYNAYLDSGNVVLAPTSGSVGVGTATPTSSFHVGGSVSFPIRTVSTNVSLGNDYTLRCTVSGITLTFPAASTCNGRVYVIINYNTGGVINTTAYLSPSAVSTTTVANGTTVWVQSDGTNWYQIK